MAPNAAPESAFDPWFAAADGGWTLDYFDYRPEDERSRETLCTLCNGWLGVRGSAEEADARAPHHDPGTYLAGGYNRGVSHVAGRTIALDVLVKWPGALALACRPEGGQWLSPDRSEVLRYRQQLDCRRGLLRRGMRLRDDAGRETTILSWRLVSMADPHLACIRWTIIPHNWFGSLEVRSALDGNVQNRGVARHREFEHVHIEVAGTGCDDRAIWLEARCRRAPLSLALASRLRATRNGRPVPLPRRCRRTDRAVEESVMLEARQGEPIALEKIVAIASSRDDEEGVGPLPAALRALERSGSAEALRADHERAWDELWLRYELDVRPAGDLATAARVDAFHLIQTLSPRIEHRDVGAPARGLHGEGYFGHIFWDQLFIDSWLRFRSPETARALLAYRYRRPDAAREQARALGCRGALFPWRSARDGREQTPPVQLNPRDGSYDPDHTSLQRHINSAIAHAVWQYHRTTADTSFLERQGAELFVEICRFWAGAFRRDPSTGRYHLRGVVGPDEFHQAYPDSGRPGVDDNAYTNMMAAWCLRTAPAVLDAIPAARRRELLEQLGNSSDELEAWRDVATHIFVPLHENRIIAQFAGYERLAELDWDGYRARYGDVRRIDRILDAEGDSVLRYKASKQADVLMLFYLLPFPDLSALLAESGYRFDAAMAERTIAYYEPRTSHGSSLSGVVHAVVDLRWGRADAWQRFESAVQFDVTRAREGQSTGGIHLAAMAGALDLLARCIAGVEAGVEMLEFDLCPAAPRLEIRLPLLYRGSRVEVWRTRDALVIATGDDWPEGSRIAFRGGVHRLGPGQRLSFNLG
jgi:trehalose/maltose hydrolase-like predicted phosphorylase